MFVGESGIMRIVQRTCEVMKEHDTNDVRRFGAIDLPTMQKWMNFHYSICLDLFGQERSTNAANYFSMGLKGRFQESRLKDDHQLDGEVYKVPVLDGKRIASEAVPAITASNERLRAEFTRDSQRGVDRFNKVIADHGIDFSFTLSHEAFNRGIGVFSGVHATPEGDIIDDAEWEKRKSDWLPTPEDREFVNSLMVPVTEPGRMAGWIAAPRRGIHGQSLDYEYVKFH